MEPDAAFCANCGTAAEGASAPVPAAPGPAMPAMAAPMAAPPGVPMGGPMPPIYLKPPRNPRQLASYSAAVMVMVCGIFALIFGNTILYHDAWVSEWDWQTDTETTFIDSGPFFAGVMFLLAFAVSMMSTYSAFRLQRYELAVAGPIMLLVSYFSTLAYESFMLIVSVHILILSIISLALLYYAIPIYAGRRAHEPELNIGNPLPPPTE